MHHTHARSVTFYTWAVPELESGQTASILRMPGHGLGKFCNISHLGMALVTYYRTQIHQDAVYSIHPKNAWAWPWQVLKHFTLGHGLSDLL